MSLVSEIDIRQWNFVKECDIFNFDDKTIEQEPDDERVLPKTTYPKGLHTIPVSSQYATSNHAD